MQGGATLSPGKQFLQWTVVERLGGGAFGDVYKILNSNGASFALKTESTAVETSVRIFFTNFCLMTDFSHIKIILQITSFPHTGSDDGCHRFDGSFTP